MCDEEKECCPKFDPAPWQEKEVIWKDKLFIKETMPLFLHMPLPGIFGKKVQTMWEKIEKANVKIEGNDFLMLSRDASSWKGELYINVSKEVLNAENVKLSGNFLTKVFDGPFNAVPQWITEMEKYVSGKGKKVKDYYFYYTTCPKCAKKYGHNYVVVFAQVE